MRKVPAAIRSTEMKTNLAEIAYYWQSVNRDLGTHPLAVRRVE
jgi:hypothetical protein